MTRSTDQILRADVISREVSRLRLPNTTLSDIWGWGLTARDPDSQGANTFNFDARTGSYDVYNSTRKVATARVPGTASSRQAPQEVSKVFFTIPRSTETIPLTHEDLHNRRAIGGPSSALDAGGQNYISRQMRYLAQRYGNLIEFQTAAMLRGSYTFDQEGDDLHQTFSGGQDTVDYRVPGTNKGQLAMTTGLGTIIDASWATATTDIPLHLFKINEGFNELTGRGLEHAVCGSDVWNYVVNNDAVVAQGGSANVVFETLERRGPGNFLAVLRSIPWLQWHIVDYTLEVWDGTSAFTQQKLIEADHISFFPEPDSEVAEYYNGGEWITEGPSGTPTFQFGFHSFGYPSHDPSGWNLASYLNGFPALYNPNAIAYADVTP